MYFFDFVAKLKKLNPAIVVEDRVGTRIFNDDGTPSEWAATRISLRRAKRMDDMTQAEWGTVVDSHERSYLLAHLHGHFDEYLCGCPTGWVPEHTVFTKRGRILALGWRDILLRLAKSGVISLERAKRVFSASSLGEASWDKLSLSSRVLRTWPPKKKAANVFIDENGDLVMRG